MTAVEVIAATVADSPSAPTIVALGPLTNLEDAFAADPKLADHIAGIHAMLGAIDTPGNVLVDGHTAPEHLEWNAYADPWPSRPCSTRTSRCRSCRSMPPTTSRCRRG